MSRPTEDPPSFIPDVARLLATGGDSRQILGDDGRNRYGCSFAPVPNAIEFGSCTGSSIGPRGYAAAAEFHERLGAVDRSELPQVAELEHERHRRDLRRLLLPRSDDVDLVLAPSGTDAELVVLALFAARDERGVDNIVLGTGEVGSGTAKAAAAVTFDEMLPSGRTSPVGSVIAPELYGRTTVTQIRVRSADGTIRPVDDVDAEVTARVEAAVAAGRRALVHIVAHSKTGVHAPSLGAVDRMRQRHGDAVGVVVDSAQGRFSRRGMSDELRKGSAVIVTGSKFFGGPPFSGLVLVPPELQPSVTGLTAFPSGFSGYFTSQMPPRHWHGVRAALPDEPNYGVLLRWEAALAEMDAYYAVDPATRLDVLRAYESIAPQVFGASPYIELDPLDPPILADSANRLLESKTTVLSFRICDPTGRAWSRDELATLHADLNREFPPSHLPDADPDVSGTAVHIGQPVGVGEGDDPSAMLRIAIGARDVVDIGTSTILGESLADRIEVLRHRLTLARDKIDALVESSLASQ